MKTYKEQLLTSKLKVVGVIDQKEHPQKAKKKKVDKPWRYWFQYAEDSKAFSHMSFATQDQAERFLDKEARRYSCHPSTGKPWGPAKQWIEGPKETNSKK